MEVGKMEEHTAGGEEGGLAQDIGGIVVMDVEDIVVGNIAHVVVVVVVGKPTVAVASFGMVGMIVQP